MADHEMFAFRCPTKDEIFGLYNEAVEVLVDLHGTRKD